MLTDPDNNRVDQIMRNTLMPFSLALLLALGAPLAAQDTTEDAPATEEPATDAPAEEAPADPDAFDMGTPIPAEELEPGQPFVAAVFGDWSLRCVNNPDGADLCTLYQLLMDQDGNSVAEIGLIPLPDGGEAAAGATIVAPMETLLTANLRMSIDGGQARMYPFTYCSERPASPMLSSGCISRIGFTAADITQFKAGNAAKLTIVPAVAPDQRVELTVSLTGFTAAMDAATNGIPE